MNMDTPLNLEAKQHWSCERHFPLSVFVSLCAVRVAPLPGAIHSLMGNVQVRWEWRPGQRRG